MTYFLHLLTSACVYMILGMSLGLLVGRAGMVSLCHGATCGVGAYAAGLAVTKLGCGGAGAGLAAVAAGGLLGVVGGVLLVRLRGDVFVAGTLAIQMMLEQTMNNLEGVTNGPLGITGIPISLRLFRGQASVFALPAIAAVATGVVFWAIRSIGVSPFGRILRALRDDELYTQTLGINTDRARTVVFVASSIMGAVAGWLYCFHTLYIDPTAFTLSESVFILAVVLVGGRESVWAPCIGAIVVVTFPELLRMVHVAGPMAAHVRQVVFGVAIVIGVAAAGIRSRRGEGRAGQKCLPSAQ